MEHRIKELRISLGQTQREFYDHSEITTSFENFKNVERGERALQVDVAIAIASKHGVSLDWLYKQSAVDEKNSKDTMINIVLALSKIFSLAIKRTPYSNRDVVLLIEERFAAFLRDIRDYENLTSDAGVIDKQTYNNGRKNIFKKHKDTLKELFDEATFTEGEAMDIYGVESKSYKELNDTILNYLT